MKKFHIRYSDGTTAVIKAMSEDMARQFAMENKYGSPFKNTTWPCSNWNGLGLSVTEIIASGDRSIGHALDLPDALG